MAFIRERMLAAIKRSPGITSSDLAREMVCRLSSVSNTGKRLVSEGAVVRFKPGGLEVNWYCPEDAPPDQPPYISKRDLVLRIVREQPGIRGSSLARAAGIYNSLRVVITPLVLKGLVVKKRVGWHAHWYPVVNEDQP